MNGKEYVVVASGEAGNAKIPELPTNPPRPNAINVFTVR